jgi:hypothetical protein
MHGFYLPTMIRVLAEQINMQHPRFASVNLELKARARTRGAGAGLERRVNFDCDAECDSLHTGGDQKHTLCDERGLWTVTRAGFKVQSAQAVHE